MLAEYGWDTFFAAHFVGYDRAVYWPARVTIVYNNYYMVIGPEGERLADLAGKLKHTAQSASELPAVGDWVACTSREGETRAIIQQVLPRRNKFVRRTAGDRPDEQVVAANLDYLFVVTGLNEARNWRRLERYLAIAREQNVTPVVILNKADLHPTAEAETAYAATQIALGTPVHLTSCATHAGVEALGRYFSPGTTVALVGSSGVGKSSLINLLLREERLAVQAVDGRGKGRHTTIHRQLLRLPQAGCIIDTPGMRELQAFEPTSELEAVFDDIDELGLRCRFANCRHDREPGCAVQQAVAAGQLEAGRLASYRKLFEESQRRTREKRFAKAKQKKPTVNPSDDFDEE